MCQMMHYGDDLRGPNLEEQVLKSYLLLYPFKGEVGRKERRKQEGKREGGRE